MRDNSGDGKSQNNNHDPTLKEHENSAGPAQQSGGGGREDDKFEIAGNARVRGEEPSPGKRERGEGASNEPARPADS